MLNFDPADFPRLREFARGYLHQDVLREYGSAEAAIKAFLADVGGKEQQDLSREALRLRLLARGWSLEEDNGALNKLGAAWRAQTKDEFLAIINSLC